MQDISATAQVRIRSQLVQIFRYIQALDQIRNPAQKVIEDHSWLMWFHDFPDHPVIRRGRITTDNDSDDTSSDDFIFKVGRPKLTEPPNPPQEIMPWLRNGWQNVYNTISIYPTITQTINGQERQIQLQDHERRKRLLDDWIAKRDKWAYTELPARRAMDIYEKLYALLPVIERDSERIELMVGDGIVTWRHTNGTFIHYPSLLLHVQLAFDPEIPEFTIVDTGQTPELYTAMFQTIPDILASEIARCREDHQQGEYHPLGGEETVRFMKRLISQLSPQGEFIESDNPLKNNSNPTIKRDPVLFLRPRNLGVSNAVRAILETIPKDEELSAALTSLVKINADSPQIESNTIDNPARSYSFNTPNGEDEDILLSKPANSEQLEIAKRLERDAAVLVQGPPGTGKTHTIANLIGHLLAQGKSVLVTSEKPKALRVLKEKVVPPLQPLCVSILTDDSRKEMEATIDAISERLAFSNLMKLEHEAAALTKQRLDILHQIRDLRKKLIDARGSEYRAIIIAGETFPPAEAARHIERNQQTAGWIPGPVMPDAPLPLSIDELLKLYNSNQAITSKDEQELSLLLPKSEQLLPPIDFARIVQELADLRRFDLGYRRDLWVRINANSSHELIQTIHQRLINEIEPLRNLTGWQAAVIEAGRAGGAYQHLWEDLVQEIEYTYHLAAQAQIWLLKYDPQVRSDCLPGRLEKTLDNIIDYLKRGGKLSGIKLAMNKDWKILIENSFVQGKSPEATEHFEAIRYFVLVSNAQSKLAERWRRQMSVFGSADVINVPPTESVFYQFVQPIMRYLRWYPDIWKPLENEIKQQGFLWEKFLAEVPVNHVEHGEMIRLRRAVVELLPEIIKAEAYRRQYIHSETILVELQRNLEQVISSSRAEAIYHLRDAIARRDVTAYRSAYENLTDLHSKTELLLLRRALLTKMEKVAPGWATMIRERIGVHGERNLLGNPVEAWQWRQLNDELDRRTKVSLTELPERIVHLSEELFRITAELVEKKAWIAQVRRTTLEQQRALQGWRELMRKVGKGTGKRAPRLLAEARKLMPICQSAVPVWIMPLSYVAKNFDMTRNRFDVVIIDEASQADITALIAVYMGKQVLVVGDDEQVSPLGVGQNLDDLQRLIDEHLQGIPLKDLYDGKLSIYSLARTTFTPICLLEHFRCVSPIIQFSNELSYSGKIKPLRDDSEVRRRPATVAYAVNSRSKQGKVNVDEANVVASLLIAASEQPEYRDASFGVISMVGLDQAVCIETLLRQCMPATEFINRRVLCGDPAQFQGDERDVVFLSMVDTPDGNGPLPLRSEEGHDDMFKKRFNVAASRARDQMWIVHSLDPENDLKQGDIRRRLILHARDQHARNHAIKEQERKVESVFEKQVFDRLVKAGYRVKTQWHVGAYRIDMVVEGNNQRLAVECDGDRWHSQEKLEEDMARQAVLERLGWRFVRIRGSQFFRDPDAAMGPVFARLRALGIPPEGAAPLGDGNLEGKDLKDRVIRRANELRQQWKEQEGQVSNPRLRNENNRSLLSQREEKTSQNQLLQEQASAPTLRIPYNSSAGKPSEHLKANPVIFLASRGLRVIDKRSSGGCLWVIGGQELEPILNELRKMQVIFTYAPQGGEVSNHQPAWFTR